MVYANITICTYYVNDNIVETILATLPNKLTKNRSYITTIRLPSCNKERSYKVFVV